MEKSTSSRKERLAVALSDLERLAEQMRIKLVAGKLDLSKAVRVGDKGEVPAVVFSCDLLTAATVCDLLRSYDRQHGDPPTRIYINRSFRWARLGDTIILTMLVDEKAVLHPDVFVDCSVMGPVPAATVIQFRKG